MADYVQEMAAANCVFDSGKAKAASMRLASCDAHDGMARTRESGEGREWIGGRFMVAGNGTCRAHFDTAAPRARLDALEGLSGR
ncbi:MAG: hypothetical protein IJ087_07095 [Eggerthellaceae bacterium]|nr:hypothetical protein [Eggerthellaceae bacterium]